MLQQMLNMRQSNKSSSYSLLAFIHKHIKYYTTQYIPILCIHILSHSEAQASLLIVRLSYPNPVTSLSTIHRFSVPQGDFERKDGPMNLFLFITSVKFWTWNYLYKQRLTGSLLYFKFPILWSSGKLIFPIKAARLKSEKRFQNSLLLLKLQIN